MMSFFCFKQKTAYEMRISDWSSDVCSSDLPRCDGDGGTMARAGSRGETRALLPDVASRYLRRRAEEIGGVVLVALAAALAVALVGFDAADPAVKPAGVASGRRLEEHPYELHSLTPTPYAVCCVKKKT